MNKKPKVASKFIPINALLSVTILQLTAHYTHTPVWLIIFVLMVCSLIYLYFKSQRSVIPFIVRSFMIVASTAVFILYYRTNFSVDMAASFLLLAGTLKLIELRQTKDLLVFVLTMLYLSAVSFLFEQGIFQVLLQLMVIAISFYILFIHHLNLNASVASDWLAIRLHISSMSKLIVVAIPFVIILFLFFPRISPLWQMPMKTLSTKAGFSSEMSPGDVSKLAKSSDPAFRVTFNMPLPKRSNLYWRGLVLDQFDGRKWTRNSHDGEIGRLNKVDSGHFFETNHPTYQVMLEPHQQKWVFGLEGSESASSNVKSFEMGLFFLKAEAIQATRYQMELPLNNVSVKLPEVPTGFSLKKVNREKSYQGQDLQLPSQYVNPRTQEYVKSLQLKFNNDYQLLVYLLKQFNKDTFFYTLEPPLIGKHFVDEFLFDVKSGFCGHYASSLAYMLRLAGIPARVVIGYQGGEFNEKSEYLIVSQNDAHAWVEAYFPELGWVRVDPTAMVAPSRISDGSRLMLANDSAFSESSPFASAAMRYSAINWLRLRIDEINFQWQNLVVNYNQDQQKKFVTNVLGEYSLLGISLFFVYLLVAFFLMMMAYLWHRRLSGYTRAEKNYMIWLFILSRFGLKRQKGESPRTFLQRIHKTKFKRLSKITEKRTRILEEQQYRDKK